MTRIQDKDVSLSRHPLSAARLRLIGRGFLFSVTLVAACLIGFNASGQDGKAKSKTGKVATQKSKGGEAEGKSSPEAVSVYADAASFQNNGALDLAVDEWKKFLERFPTDPLAPKATHYLGVCQMQQKDFAGAAAEFEKVRKNSPEFPLLEETLVNLGYCHYMVASEKAANEAERKKAYEQSVSALSAVIQKYPTSKFGDQVLYYLADAQFALNNKDAALVAYRKVLSDYKDSSLRCDALYGLGTALESMAKYSEALPHYQQFLEGCASHDSLVEVRMRKAECLLQTNALDEADQLFGEVAKSPDYPLADNALIRQALCKLKRDQFSEAAKIYARVANEFPNSKHRADATAGAGLSLYRAEQWDEAAKWLDQAVTLQLSASGKKDASLEAAHWLCRAHLKRRAYNDVLAAVEKVRPSLAGSNWQVPILLDEADAMYEDPQRRKLAIERYRDIAKTDPKHELAPQSLYNAAYGALELKDFALGAELAQQFATSFSRHALSKDAEFVRAECLVGLGKLKEADGIYETLVASDGSNDNESWRLRRLALLFGQSRFDEVVTLANTLESALKKSESKNETAYWRGLAQLQLNQTASGIESLLIATKSKWRLGDEAGVALSRALFKQQKNTEAIAAAKKVMSDYPTSALADQAHYRLAEALFAQGSYAEAKPIYTKIWTEWPTSAMAPYAALGLGWSHAKLKEFPEAIKAFSNVIEKSPQNPAATDAWYARGATNRQANQNDNAISDLKRFLESNVEGDARADGLYELGLAYVAKNDFSSAEKTFAEALEKHPQYASIDRILYELGWAQKSGGALDQSALTFARLATDYAKSPLAAEAAFHVGEEAYERKKAYSDAAKWYSTSRTLSGEAKELSEIREKSLYKLGWSHYQEKAYQPALAAFNDLVAGFPTGDLVREGNLMRGECEFRLNHFDEALRAYSTALETKTEPGKPSTAIEEVATLHAGQAASQLKKWDEALRWLGAVEKYFPESRLLAEAQYELGWALQQSGSLKDAVTKYNSAAEKSRSEVGARARFMLGEIRFEQKDHLNATKEFQKVMYGYGGENANAAVKNWQAKAGFEAGRCFEALLNDEKDKAKKASHLSAAKKAYMYVNEKHSDHELAASARKRLEELGKLSG